MPADIESAAAFLDRLEATAGPMPYRWAHEFRDVPLPEEVVEDVLCRGAMIVVYGESGCGKTYLVIDLSCHLSLGWMWLRKRTRKSIVIYVAAESGESIGLRFEAWRREHDVDEIDVAVVTECVDMRGDVDVERVIARASALVRERGQPVSLIVIDTLSRAFASGNENDSADMGALVRNSDRLRRETGAAVAWVHHTGKDTAKGARGHSLLRAATDVEIEVTNRDGAVVAKLTKRRDGGEAGAEIAGRLRPVEVGIDSWGKPVTACVLDPMEGAPPAARRQAVRLTADATVALDVLRDVMHDHGRPAPETSAIPPGRRVVDLERWRERYNAVVQIDPSDDAAERAKRMDARRKGFERARMKLRAQGLVGNIGGLWWLA